MNVPPGAHAPECSTARRLSGGLPAGTGFDDVRPAIVGSGMLISEFAIGFLDVDTRSARLAQAIFHRAFVRFGFLVFHGSSPRLVPVAITAAAKSCCADQRSRNRAVCTGLGFVFWIHASTSFQRGSASVSRSSI